MDSFGVVSNENIQNEFKSLLKHSFFYLHNSMKADFLHIFQPKTTYFTRFNTEADRIQLTFINLHIKEIFTLVKQCNSSHYFFVQK